jgi:hypothetical protein
MSTAAWARSNCLAKRTPLQRGGVILSISKAFARFVSRLVLTDDDWQLTTAYRSTLAIVASG